MADYVAVAKTKDIDLGEMMRVFVNDVAVCVYNVEGEYYATQDTCTHEEASLAEGELFDDVVACPLHGAEFNVKTGQVLCFPAVVSLETYPVLVEDDQIKVLVER